MTHTSEGDASIGGFATVPAGSERCRGLSSETAAACSERATKRRSRRERQAPLTARIRPKTTDKKVLVVGAGPAGLEAAMSLGRRGYDVVLA